MVKLACGCLNVVIHAKSDGLPVDLGAVGLHVKQGDKYFIEGPREIVLNLEGIHVEHTYLVTKHVYEQWVVHRCNNCKQTTHGTWTHHDTERVLVSSNLLNDEKVIERLSMSPDYSPLFKIVIKGSSDNMPAAVDWVSNDVRDTFRGLQVKVDSYLVAEEQAMEERIRDFQEQEREKYDKLQSKAKNDRNAIISTVLFNIYKNVSDSLQEAMKESPVGSMDTGDAALNAMVSVSPLTFGKLPDPSSPRYQPYHPVSRSESNRGRQSDQPVDRSFRSTKPKKEQEADEDDVFSFDPGFQEDPNLPFSDSEDEEQHDSDDSSAEEESQKEGKNETSTFSSSMPISVPAPWGRQVSHIDIDDIDADPKDPESMAESIQRLARSIHGDDSQIFGELPRSRTRSRAVTSQSSFKH